MAVADVSHGRISAWEESDVGWDRLPDESPHDVHHARMAGFLHDHGVNVVVVDHIGSCLGSALFTLDIAVHPGAAGAGTSGRHGRRRGPAQPLSRPGLALRYEP